MFVALSLTQRYTSNLTRDYCPEYSEEGLAQQGPNSFEDEANIEKSIVDPTRIVDLLHFFDEAGFAVREQVESSLYAPIWQTSPVLRTGLVNENLSRRGGSSDIAPIIQGGAAGFGDFFGLEPGDIRSTTRETAQIATLRSLVEAHEGKFNALRENQKAMNST